MLAALAPWTIHGSTRGTPGSPSSRPIQRPSDPPSGAGTQLRQRSLPQTRELPNARSGLSSMRYPPIPHLTTSSTYHPISKHAASIIDTLPISHLAPPGPDSSCHAIPRAHTPARPNKEPLANSHTPGRRCSRAIAPLRRNPYRLTRHVLHPDNHAARPPATARTTEADHRRFSAEIIRRAGFRAWINPRNHDTHQPAVSPQRHSPSKDHEPSHSLSPRTHQVTLRSTQQAKSASHLAGQAIAPQVRRTHSFDKPSRTRQTCAST